MVFISSYSSHSHSTVVRSMLAQDYVGRDWRPCEVVARLSTGQKCSGYIESPLKERGDYYTQDGYLSIVQIANTRTSYQVRIARQFMMTVFKQMINFSSLFSLQSAPPVSIHNRWIEFLLFSLCPRIEDIPPPFPSLSTWCNFLSFWISFY